MKLQIVILNFGNFITRSESLQAPAPFILFPWGPWMHQWVASMWRKCSCKYFKCQVTFLVTRVVTIKQVFYDSHDCGYHILFEVADFK